MLMIGNTIAGKLRRIKVRSHGGANGGDCNAHTHSSPWVRQLWEWCIINKHERGKMYISILKDILLTPSLSAGLYPERLISWATLWPLQG